MCRFLLIWLFSSIYRNRSKEINYDRDGKFSRTMRHLNARYCLIWWRYTPRPLCVYMTLWYMRVLRWRGRILWLIKVEWLTAYSVKKLIYLRCVHSNNVHMLISHQNWIFHYYINRISYSSCYIFCYFVILSITSQPKGTVYFCYDYIFIAFTHIFDWSVAHILTWVAFETA